MRVLLNFSEQQYPSCTSCGKYSEGEHWCEDCKIEHSNLKSTLDMSNMNRKKQFVLLRRIV